MSLLKQAIQFRQKFNQPIFAKDHKFCEEDLGLLEMQGNLICEESDEASESLAALDDLIRFPDDNEDSPQYKTELSATRQELLKELADVVFVCFQLAACLGLDLDTAMNRVFESNNTKVDDNGNPVYNRAGKVMKTNNYVPPTLSDLV
jgi:NTP pyrophosphatase (non-canonical NTP hydrolase)